jgi:glycosyltransferase involved in cell wall biosynthesis
MMGAGLDPESVRAKWGVEIPPNLLLTGAAPREWVQDALSACSVLVVTSKREGLPTLVLEAMAHSRSVVVSDEPGCTEVVDHGAYGSIYRLGDMEDLAEKTRAALERGTGAPGARERVLSEYDWRAIAPRLDAIYSRSAS